MPKSRLFPPLLALAALASPARAEPPDPARLEFFEKRVRPILTDHCAACHSADTKPAGGFRVDDRAGILGGGNSGAGLVPGKPGESLLIKRVSGGGKRQMPLEGEKLTPEQIATLTKWVADGAAWPEVAAPNLDKPRPKYDDLRREHWAFQPVGRPGVPAVKDSAWPASDVDRFVLAKLEAAGLKPVPDAARTDLIRRITFDLTGLPPTPEEIDAFLTDDKPGAFERVVDRLLASGAFGERWGRHWLDVARYAESTGPSRNIPYPHAWKYRDYVLDAVSADVPFDRFLAEQIAGDLLPAADGAERDRLTTATGFLALGPKDVNQRFKVRFQMDNVDEQIDAVTRSTLALTVSCARCHDHKFDPVPQADYYALAGIFTSTENAAGVRSLMGGAGLAYYAPDNLARLGGVKLPEPDPAKVAQLTAEVAEAKKAWDAIRGTPEGLKPGPNGQPTQRPFRLKFEGKQAELLALSDPAQRGGAVHGARDAKEVGDTNLRVRGEAEKLGPVVPRGFLSAVAVPGARPVNPSQSGRLELARWLTSPANPLTARVAVNRAWHHLFGAGIVTTVDNFGATGDAPSHPELLDYLAGRFVENGWSLKKLVRELVLTRAYQLSAESTAAHVKLDPANRLVWRHAPRRLDAEEVRDAVLASAGTLDRTRRSGSAARQLKMVEMPDNGPVAKLVRDEADADVRRSVYLPLLRGLTPRALEVFDPVEQTLVTGKRDATTVPAQALFLLNSPFVRKQFLALAARLLKDDSPSDADRVASAYRLALGREPSAAEASRAAEFVAAYRAEYREPVAAAAKPKPRPAERPKPAEPPPDPDQADQSGVPVTEEQVRANDARLAAWAALAQALFASAEFRYTR